MDSFYSVFLIAHPYILKNFCCITAMTRLTLTLQKQQGGIAKKYNIIVGLFPIYRALLKSTAPGLKIMKNRSLV
jgi:hypothetical protein